MTKEELEETRVLFIGAWDVIGRRAPRMLNEIERLQAELEGHKAKAAEVWSGLNARLNAALLRTDEQQVRADKAEAELEAMYKKMAAYRTEYMRSGADHCIAMAGEQDWKARAEAAASRETALRGALEKAHQGCGDHDTEPLDENGGDQRDTGEMIKRVLASAPKYSAVAPEARCFPPKEGA